jgi:DNA integrity scanning protein DisA with diadenylate cyclase activity
MDNPETQTTSGTRHRKQTKQVTQHRLCVVMISTYKQRSLVDQVYVPDTSLLEEYVLNDTGKIYTGNRKQINGKRWNFGQVILRKDGQI